jgi:hypothetical protein
MNWSLGYQAARAPLSRKPVGCAVIGGWIFRLFREDANHATKIHLPIIAASRTMWEGSRRHSVEATLAWAAQPMTVPVKGRQELAGLPRRVGQNLQPASGANTMRPICRPGTLPADRQQAADSDGLRQSD